MRVLVDIAHPAHVHFYRFILQDLLTMGHQWKIASRRKDVTTVLLDSLGLPHTPISTAGVGVAGLTRELLQRDGKLLKVAREFRPDVILTRSPAGTHIGRFLGIPSVFDTDNGRSAGIHYRAAAPFASVITTPDCLPADLGPKQARYPSYKAMAFLHPNRFQPDPGIRRSLRVDSAERYSIVRLVSMTASHDHAESGMPMGFVREAVRFLMEQGRVFVSSEFGLPPELADLKLNTDPSEFHSALAHASLSIGDSGSVAAESAILGVPSIFVSSFSGRLPYVEELSKRYSMITSVQPSDEVGFFGALEQWKATPEGAYRERRKAILRDKVDLTEWYVGFVNEMISEKI